MSEMSIFTTQQLEMYSVVFVLTPPNLGINWMHNERNELRSKCEAIENLDAFVISCEKRNIIPFPYFSSFNVDKNCLFHTRISIEYSRFDLVNKEMKGRYICHIHAWLR